MSGKPQTFREPPSELKSIKPYILRGNQLRNADPVITYYCYFWAIKHILANGLHSATPECTAWTTDLMDELERRKAALGSNELIHDDMAAQAYVENFALKIFNNGAAVVENGKATSQTSDTLLAGATILEVCKVFGELDPETLQKIKFAKFHAARIWKAISTGQDPNPPAPAPKTPSIEDMGPPPDIYGNEPSNPPPPPTIEEVPDESITLEPKLARTSIYDESLHPSRQSPTPQEPTSTPDPFPSPPRELKQGGYFPAVPTAHEPSAPTISSTMSPTNVPFPGDMAPRPFYQQQQQPPPQNPYNQAPIRHNFHQYQEQAPPPVQAPRRVKKDVTPEEMAKAQKHARWAISALDYEDVETAIKQFREGLSLLGVD